LNGVLNKFDGDSGGLCENLGTLKKYFKYFVKTLTITFETFPFFPLARPRHIKSHLPAFLLPDEMWEVKPKVSFLIFES
jgi:hypothetical protein